MLHWFQFRVHVGEVVQIHAVPVMGRSTENPDDYAGAHPAMRARARATLAARYAADHPKIDFVQEVYPYK